MQFEVSIPQRCHTAALRYTPSLTRLIGRSDLQLHEESSRILALGTRRVRGVYVLPAILSTHYIVHFLSAKLCPFGDLLRDGEVIWAGGTDPFVPPRIIVSNEEDVCACWTEQHLVVEPARGRS